ncbi:Cupin domain protein [compost metagenome]
MLASSVASREVELWEWRLEPGEVYQCEADADGWSEQLYVFEGCLTLVIEDQQHQLQAGDFLSYASNRMHAYRNDGEVATRFVRNVVI